jgi:acyl carrier protein
MERLEGTIALVTDASSRIERAEFLTGSLNTVPEWNQSPRNSTKTFLGGDNSDERSRSQKQSQTEEAIHTYLVSYLSKLLLVEPHEIDVRLPFQYYGMGSVEVFSLTRTLEDWLGRRLSPKLVYEYPTIEVLARHLAEEVECG